jgi:amino acid transporter
MRYLFEAFALFIAFAGLTWYNKRDPGRYRKTPPQIFTKWSRQSRVLFVCTSMVLLVLVAIPVIVALVFVVFDKDSCNSAVSFPWACNAVVRIPAAMAVFGLLIAMVLKGSTILARVQNYGVDYNKY